MEAMQLPVDSFAAREEELTRRAIELNRRLADVEQREQALDELAVTAAAVSPELDARLAEIERREEQVERAHETLEAQREQLQAVRAEYESRRETLTTRARELEAVRDRLRAEHAEVVAKSMQVEQRERAMASADVALGRAAAPPGVARSDLFRADAEPMLPAPSPVPPQHALPVAPPAPPVIAPAGAFVDPVRRRESVRSTLSRLPLGR